MSLILRNHSSDIISDDDIVQLEEKLNLRVDRLQLFRNEFPVLTVQVSIDGVRDPNKETHASANQKQTALRLCQWPSIVHKMTRWNFYCRQILTDIDSDHMVVFQVKSENKLTGKHQRTFIFFLHIIYYTGKIKFF